MLIKWHYEMHGATMKTTMKIDAQFLFMYVYFYCLHVSVQTGPGAHPASCKMGTGGKVWPGRAADHSQWPLTVTPEHTQLHTHTHTHTWYDSSRRGIGPLQKPLRRTHTTFTTHRHPFLPAGFEPVIPGSERPQNYAVDRAVTEIGQITFLTVIK